MWRLGTRVRVIRRSYRIRGELDVARLLDFCSCPLFYPLDERRRPDLAWKLDLRAQEPAAGTTPADSPGWSSANANKDTTEASKWIYNRL